MAKQTAVSVIPKIPLDEAALILRELCEAIDNGLDLDAALLERFADAKLDVSNAVDRRIIFFHKIDEELAAARAVREAWKAKMNEWGWKGCCSHATEIVNGVVANGDKAGIKTDFNTILTLLSAVLKNQWYGLTTNAKQVSSAVEEAKESRK